MRDFLIILSNIGRFFLLFEKSLSQGYHEEIKKELKELRKELQRMKNQCMLKIETKRKETECKADPAV